jgi:hypothetical protein
MRRELGVEHEARPPAELGGSGGGVLGVLVGTFVKRDHLLGFTILWTRSLSFYLNSRFRERY